MERNNKEITPEFSISLPCRPGDVVFHTGYGMVCGGIVTDIGFHWHRCEEPEGIVTVSACGSSDSFYFEDFGKIIFTTEEDAKASRHEQQGGEK